MTRTCVTPPASRCGTASATRDDVAAKESDPIYGDIALAIPNGKAAALLLFQIERKITPDDKLAAAAEHVARYGTDRRPGVVVRFTAQSHRPLNADADAGRIPRRASARGETLRSVNEASLGTCSELDDDLRCSRQTAVPGRHERQAVSLGHSGSQCSSVGVGSESIDESVHAESWDDQVPGDRPEPREGFDRDSHRRGRSATSVRPGRCPESDPRADRRSGDLPESVRDRFLLVFASSSNKEARLDARDALKDAPYRTAVAVGTALAGTPSGAEDLLDAVKTGQGPCTATSGEGHSRTAQGREDSRPRQADRANSRRACRRSIRRSPNS